MADDADGYFKVYEEYSKTLRTWFVAYGIGAPVCFAERRYAAGRDRYGRHRATLLVDLVTGVLFALATYKIFSVVAG